MHVDLLAYYLWALSYLEGSIWAGCASYVTDDGGPPFDALSVDEAADGICADLAAIVASGCGYVDVLP